MGENLFNSDHKGTNPNYRNNYDRVFRQEKPAEKSRYKGRIDYTTHAAALIHHYFDGLGKPVDSIQTQRDDTMFGIHITVRLECGINFSFLATEPVLKDHPGQILDVAKMAYEQRVSRMKQTRTA